MPAAPLLAGPGGPQVYMDLDVVRRRDSLQGVGRKQRFTHRCASLITQGTDWCSVHAGNIASRTYGSNEHAGSSTARTDRGPVTVHAVSIAARTDRNSAHASSGIAAHTDRGS